MYNQAPEERMGIKNIGTAVGKQLLLQGFLVSNPEYGRAYFTEHQEKMGAWLADGTFKSKLHYTEGIDKAAEGFVDMLEGRNFGKAILRIKN